MSGASITIYESDVKQWAVTQNLINSNQAAALWTGLQQQYDERWKLSWVHLAYFLGGFLIVGSMTWFTNLAWHDATGFSLFILSSAYVVIFGYAGYRFWNQTSLPTVLGGIFATVSVCITPVVVYSLQKMLDWWPKETPYLAQEASMVIAGFIAIRYIRFPFLTAPISFALYAICQDDIATLIFGENATATDHYGVSVVFGVIAIFVSNVIDRQKLPQDFAFWGYLFGVMAFWGGLSALYYDTFHQKGAFQLVYLSVNLLMMGLSVKIQRNVFLVFGGLGATYVVADFLFTEATVEQNAYISIIFGSILIGAGYRYATTKNSEFASWAYFFGVMIFWCGLTTLYVSVYDAMVFKYLYFAVNVGLMGCTFWLKNYTFVVFGTIGAMGFIGDMVYTYYWNSYYLPLILTAIGLAFIAIAIYFSRKMRASKASRATETAQQQQQQQHPYLFHPGVQNPQGFTLFPVHHQYPYMMLPSSFEMQPRHPETDMEQP